jgi:hypothetical protein
MPRRVSCIPSTDRAFREAAGVALASLDGEADLALIELKLCALLIERFPRIDVHRQTELGRAFDEDVWYAYRDGRPDRGRTDDPN